MKMIVFNPVRDSLPRQLIMAAAKEAIKALLRFMNHQDLQLGSPLKIESHNAKVLLIMQLTTIQFRQDPRHQPRLITP